MTLRGKALLSAILVERALEKGQKVIVAKPSGWHSVRRVRFGESKMDVITPLHPVNGTTFKAV